MKIAQTKLGFFYSFVGRYALFISARTGVNKDKPKATEQYKPINENIQFS